MQAKVEQAHNMWMNQRRRRFCLVLEMLCIDIKQLQDFHGNLCVASEMLPR